MSRNKVIEYNHKKQQFSDYLIKLFKYKDLIFAFSLRDIKSKYAQTRLGFIWVIAKPIMSVLLYVFFFEFILNWSVSDVPYSLYVFSGLIAWNMFSQLTVIGLNSVEESANIIKKIYFPKSILVFSKALSLLLDTLIVLITLVLFALFLDQLPTWNYVLLPLAILNAILLSMSLVFLFASLSVKFKDLSVALPFFLQTLMWFSNVFIDVSSFPKFLQVYIENNPLSLMVSFMRWCLIDYEDFNYLWIILFFFNLFLLALSMNIYSKVEDKNVDNL